MLTGRPGSRRVLQGHLGICRETGRLAPCRFAATAVPSGHRHPNRPSRLCREAAWLPIDSAVCEVGVSHFGRTQGSTNSVLAEVHLFLLFH